MGTLYVVATPIGNLDDVSPRTLETLRTVSVIAAEDTRHSQRLLRRYAIATPLLSYHQHNQRERRARLLRALDEGDVALITDAGTPGVSDPGADLVESALAGGHRVSPIPGPSALTAAVSASGLIDGPFVALGFLPRAEGEKRHTVARAAATGWPFVLFEAANRLSATLMMLQEAVGDRPAVLLRELTKIHEEVRPGTLGSLRDAALVREMRGEIVVVVAGEAIAPGGEEEATAVLRTLRQAGLSASQAAREAAAITGLPRSTLYDLARQTGTRSIGLEGELPLTNEDALQDTLRDQERPE